MVQAVATTRATFAWILVFILVSATGFAQIGNVDLTVGKTDESCTGNGSLTFNVSDVPPGASVSYSLFLHPNLVSPFVTLPGNSYGGLSAGTYRVVATVSLNGNSASAFADVVIENTITQLSYSLVGSPAICGDNGQIVVTALTGTAVAYEIISGPETVPLQSSNVFTGLAAGLYEVRVFDACGEGVVQAHTIFSGQAGMTIAVQNPTAVDCDNVSINLSIDEIAAFDIAYPLQVVCTIFPASGEPMIFTQTLTSGTALGTLYSEIVPYSGDVVMSYTIVVTDICGNQQQVSGSVTPTTVHPTVQPFNQTCTSSGAIVRNVIGLILTNAPDDYPGSTPIDLTGSIVDNTVVFPSLPFGVYEFLATGLCGEVFQLSINVQPAQGSTPSVNVFEGCDPGTGSVYIGGAFSQMTLVAAPPAFTTSLPMDVTSFIDAVNGGFVMSGLPPGTYTFSFTDSCGNPFTRSGTVVGFTESFSYQLFEYCGAFDLQISYTSNASGSAALWLQRYNPVTGQWGHPGTGVPYVDGTPPNLTNSRLLNNNALNPNLAYTGKFRVMTSFPSFIQGTAVLTTCTGVVLEFETVGLPKIDQVYSFSCTPGSFDLVVEATGLMPLTYRITSFNGGAVMIDNGTNNIFNGLTAGSYNFQVEDACQNIVNRVFDITEPLSFAITGADLCVGEDGQLSVPGFPFLQYEWVNTANPSAVLSTTATLDFSDFSASDAGQYSVRIWNSDPLSCLDITLFYNLTLPAAPQAGVASPQQICGIPAQLDLLSLLQSPFDTTGQWTTTAPGTITGNIWTPGTVDFGNYTFTYTVTGMCDSASATTTATLMAVPTAPDMTGTYQICEGETLELSIPTVPGVDYVWQGPNGFAFTGNTITIDEASSSAAGTYTVSAQMGSCESVPATLLVEVLPAPVVSIDQICDGAQSVLVASIPGGFLDGDYVFEWSGPNGFNAVGNPANITGAMAGTYTLDVTSESGCVSRLPFEVVQTVCAIPQGVSPNNDGSNDNFDLTGLGVTNLKIFNRYGMTVYEQANYVDQWKGQDYNGNLLPSATYYYLVRLNTGEARTGWVYLMHE